MIGIALSTEGRHEMEIQLEAVVTIEALVFRFLRWDSHQGIDGLLHVVIKGRVVVAVPLGVFGEVKKWRVRVKDVPNGLSIVLLQSIEVLT